MPRVFLLALVALSLVGVVACGDSETKSNNAYVSAVNDAQNQFADSIEDVAGEITPTSSAKQDRETLRKFSQAVDRAVSQLRAVKPPSKVRALHEDLIKSIARYRAEVEKARRAFASKDRRTLDRAERRFQAAIRAIGARINRTTTAINARLHE
jgi:hypothetical protein